MDDQELRDDQWEQLAPLIPGGSKGKRGPRSENRRFINALLWMGRSGARWKDLPERYGPYQIVKRRYYRWVENGVIDRIFAFFAEDADLEWASLDSTIIRAHSCAAGARRKKGGSMPRALAAPKAA
jgi:transposase